MRPFAMLALTLFCLTQAARAQEPDKRAEAIALFDQARALMQSGNYEAACPKLAEAQRLTPGLGILFNLADCYEHVGKLTSAWASFREVASLAASSGQADREKDARVRAEGLEPRLSRLQIDVSAPIEGLIVTRNGEQLSRTQWNSAIPVDADRYKVEAQAPGKVPWEKEVTVEGEGATTKVVVPALANAGAPPPPSPVPPRRRNPDPLPPADDGDAPRTWQAPLGIALLSVGAAALVVGGVVAGVAKATADSADCDADDLCSQDGVDDRDKAQVMGNAATGLIIGGAVVGAAGLVIFLTAPSANKESAKLSLGVGDVRLRFVW